MKTLSVLAVLLVLSLLPASAQSRITLTITVTNKPAPGDTITINGAVRTWNTAETSLTILTNLVSVNANKTNFFRQIARWSYAGPLNLVDNGTNSLKLVGSLNGALSASASGTWATLSLSTQGGGGFTYTALYPMENMASSTDRVNEASSLAYGLGQYSTNAFPTNGTLMSNFVAKGASVPTTNITVVGAPPASVLFESNGTMRGSSLLQYTNGSLLVDGSASFGGGATFGGGADFNDEAVFNAAVIIPAGATAGHVLTSDATGLAAWAAPTGGTGGSATNAQPPSAVLTNLASNPYTGYTNGIPAGQVLFLDAAFGSDSTASRTNLLRSYATASNAMAAILSGDTLVVRGGTNFVAPNPGDLVSGLGISNRNNIRLTGEPGSILQLLSWGSTNHGSILTLYNCTNVQIDGLTFRGLRTNSVKVKQSYAVRLINCEKVRFYNNDFIDWQNQGVTDLGSGSINANQDIQVVNCRFSYIGGTNHIALGGDGAAISVNANNLLVKDCWFTNCYRHVETYDNGMVSGLRAINNHSFGCIDKAYMFHAATNSDFQILGNHDYGYSATLPTGVTEAYWIYALGGSNILVQGNSVNGLRGFEWEVVYSMLDWKLWNNEFADTAIAIYAFRTSGSAVKQNRLSIKGNKFRNTSSTAVYVTGNNTYVGDNEFADCNTGANAAGVVGLGYAGSAASTNMMAVRNHIYTSQGTVSPSMGITIAGTSYSSYVLDNEILNQTSSIQDAGVGTLFYIQENTPTPPLQWATFADTTVGWFNANLGVTDPVLWLIDPVDVNVGMAGELRVGGRVSANTLTISNAPGTGNWLHIAPDGKVSRTNATDGGGSASTNLATLASGYMTVGGVTVTGTIATATATVSTFLSMAASAPILWSGLSRIVSTVDGYITLQNAAQSSFNVLRFGGTTAAFPGLGRTNGDLIVLGANGDFGGTSTNRLLVPGGLLVGQGSGAAAVMTLSDANGTNYQLATPGMSSNIFERGPKNMTPGVRVFLPDGGTNQATNITLAANQVVTHNGTTYVSEGKTSFTPTLVAGTGSALTNFTFLSTQPEVVFNGATNVSITGVMGTDPARVDYWNLMITNGTSTARPIIFDQTTNSWRFSGVYGTNAPSNLTNMTVLMISARSHGTNTRVGYTYFPWP